MSSPAPASTRTSVPDRQDPLDRADELLQEAQEHIEDEDAIHAVREARQLLAPAREPEPEDVEQWASDEVETDGGWNAAKGAADRVDAPHPMRADSGGEDR